MSRIITHANRATNQLNGNSILYLEPRDLMLKFSDDQIKKYEKNSITGTGFLAFRDVEKFAKKHDTNLDYVLDLGCGSGRSTNFLSTFCKKINGCDIDRTYAKPFIFTQTNKAQAI